MENNFYPFVNLPLPYQYDALEPYIDEKTMHLHHDKHLQTYINRLNDTLKNHPGLQDYSLEQLIQFAGRLPKEVGTQLRDNGGGVYNHRFFFEGLTPKAVMEPKGLLLDAIVESFESFDNFWNEMKGAALSVFGSGYAWLVCANGRLKIVTTANQNSPKEKGICPILTVDVWEHAYYLKHFNVRADYLDDFRSVINWKKAEENYGACLQNETGCKKE